MLPCGDAAEPVRPLLIELSAPTRDRTADSVHVRQQVCLDQLPTHHCEREQPYRKPGEHEVVGKPDGLRVRQAVYGMLHGPVHRGIAGRENKNQRDQGDRKEGNRSLGKADDQARPLGVRHLLHSGKGDAPAGKTGEIQPVHVEELPGA